MTPTVTRQELDDLKACVDLVALFEEHGVPVQKTGRSFKCLCPFHDEKTPSLSIDRKKGLYHCFGCGQSGDSLAFLQTYAKLSFNKALSELRLRATAAPIEPTPVPKEPQEFPYELV